MIHKHHIIPKHMGGSDDPINREKQRQACIGRKRVYNDDGTWHWGRG